MAFDAGAVEATLTLKTDQFDTDLARAKAKLADLTKNREVKVSAVFDTASLSKARKMFADLDNMISRDAAQRLKSSPQGSVLGALNSLFSPHPVTGAPSAQSSSQGGLLGKMVTQQGGGGPVGTAGNAGGNTSGTNAVRDILTGPQPGNTSTTNQIKQVLTGQGATNQQTTDQIKQMLTGQGATDVNTTDKIKQMLTGTTPGNVNTEDLIKQVVTGKGPADTTTKDTVKEAIDPASKAAVISDAGDMGDKGGRSFASMFTPHIGVLLASFHKSAGSSGSSGGAAMGKGLLDGIGPGILGINMKMASMIGGIGTLMAALPAVAGLAGVGMGVAMIGGLLVGVVKSSPKLTAQLKGIGTDATKMFTTIAAPVIPALSKAFAMIPPLLKSITPALAGIMKTIAPQISGIFSGLVPIIKGLVGVMQAAAPAFGPFIEALEKLAGSILPGIEMVIKATVPYISQFAGILGKLGSNLGGLFAAAAPAIGASMKVLGALLDLIGGLLPILMKLADVFAQALAPVIGQFAAVIKSLLPVLTIVGQVIAALAQAVIGDLVSAFGAVATLLIAIGPALGVLAKTLESVFSVLENTGVFASLGDALENIAAPLAKLISLLITQMAPILPVLVTLLSGFVTVLVTLASAGLTVVLEGVTAMLAKMPFLVPLIGAIAAAWLVWNLVMAANPIGLIVIAIAALIGAVVELVTHWTAVWGEIKAIAEDAWNFIVNGFGKYLLPLLGPVGLIALGVLELYQHWSTVWGDIKAVAQDIWNWLSQTFGTDLSGFFTKTIPGWLDELTGFFTSKLVTPVENAAKAFWTWLSGTFGTDLSGFFTKTVPGWWDQFTGFFTSRLVTPVENAAKGLWNWISGTFGTDIDGFFTKTIPGWFDQFIGFVGSRFVTPFENAVKGAWNWIVSNVFDPMDTFITKTIPGWFDTAVSAINAAWGKLENDVEVPVKFVVNDVLNPLGQAFDDITSALGLGKPIPAIKMAAGGRVRHGTTETADDVLVRVSKGETVVSAQDSRTLSPFFSAIGVPGYASGGVPNPGPGGILGFIQTLSGALGGLLGGQVNVGDAVTLAEAAKGFAGIVGKGVSGAKGTLGDILTAIPKKIVSDFMSWLTAHADAGGGEIVAYAQKFIGKIPYVWGGTDLGPAGADCSGFIEAIYNHFGISPPRTSEAQGAWVKRTGPEPGGLAFYHSPAGGPDPGHVALVSGANQVISQGGGMGPQVMQLNAMPLLWTGIPPGGFGSAGGGGTTAGGMSAGAIESLWTQLGGPASAAANMARIAFAESGDDPSIVQAGQPPGLTGYGLYQITPTSGITQNGMFGNLLNAANNTRAAIFLYNSSGYGPWSSDPVGGSLVGSGLSYASGGMINEPVIGFGQNTGQRYNIGERGPEMVTPGGGASIADVCARLERLIATTAAVPAGVGAHVGGALGGAASAASFRQRYPRGGA